MILASAISRNKEKTWPVGKGKCSLTSHAASLKDGRVSETEASQGELDKTNAVL
jgi:hypothetical protein